MKKALTRVCVAAVVAVAGVAAGQDVKAEKYALPNGMTVILHEDHSLPSATVNIWYRVGAQDEPPGRSGFAHLFEHLMFMGTARVPGNQFDILMETGGGANNASTDLHRTNYFSWGPAALLPTLLWLDADRLEDMGNTMTQEKLDKQRDVVRNELRQSVENAPYGKASEMVFKLMFQPTHPYYYGVIGTHQDLEAASVTNVKDFFATFYVPSNASMVVAGDFDSAEIKPLVEKLFASIPAGAPVTRKYERPKDPIPNHIDGVKRFTTIDRVQLPKVEYSYHSAVALGPGDAELDLAADVLASGKSSRLYKRLVIDDKIASEVDASQNGYPLGGLFQVSVLANPDADLDKVEKAVDEELAKFLKQGPTPEELERHVAARELSFLQSLQSLQRRADKLNEYEYYWGDPNGFRKDLDRYRKATPAGVREWAGKVLTPGTRLVMRVLPEEPERGASGRDARPSASGDRGFVPPAPVSFVMKNGVKAYVWSRPELPLVGVKLVSRPGGALDAPGKEGLAQIAARMMGEGAGERDALAFSNALQSIGATFGSGADHESAEASMTVLKRNLDKGLGLFGDALRRPRFEEADWTRVKRLTIDELRQAADNPRAAAAIIADRLLYGDANPYARLAVGTMKSVESLRLDEAKSALATFFDPSTTVVFVAGDITPEEAKAALQKCLGDWKGAAHASATRRTDFRIPEQPTMRLAICDRPNATQTVVHFAAPGAAFNDPARVQRRLVNTILGGSFTSRLNQNLREDHGYTYGARSAWAMRPSGGNFLAAASVQAEVTGAALREFMKEFDRLKSGDISDAEAAKARQTVRQDIVSDFEGVRGLLGTASEYVVNGLTFDSIGQDLGSVQHAQATDLNAFARTALALDHGVLVLVGDKATILEQIKDLGLPQPIFVDPTGEPVQK
jgi:predicted Zn-dependent peptidase